MTWSAASAGFETQALAIAAIKNIPHVRIPYPINIPTPFPP